MDDTQQTSPRRSGVNAAVQTPFVPTEHPLLPLPTVAEMDVLLREEKTALELLKWLNTREERIRQAIQDPLNFGFELPHWKDADRLIAEVELLYIGGGNRSGKTEWCTKRAIEAALTYPGGKSWFFQDNERTSIGTQQAAVWRFLPQQVKALNQKRHPHYKVNYTDAGGFADRILVLPNRTQILFLTYNQDPKEFQGWELGATIERGQLARAKDGRLIQNIGAVTDENLTLKWLETIRTRLATRNAKALWPYTPLEGITLAIKEFLSGVVTVESREADGLPELQLPKLPKGHVPYIQATSVAANAPDGARTGRKAAIYFFSRWNPFGGYERVRAECEGKSRTFRLRKLHGYDDEVKNLAWPKFGEWNVIDLSELPETGTNYQFVDPAGARNWGMFWVRVTPGNPSRLYIYRDWPDSRRHGEWAVPSEDPNQPDGDAGPAQKNLGYGISEYKRMILKEEKVEQERTEGTEGPPVQGKGIARQGTVTEEVDGRTVTRERIFMRFMDPRAGRNQKQAERGGTCLLDEMQAVQVDREGRVIGPSMIFHAASGVHIDDGINAVKELLDWNMEAEFCPLINEPRLYVTRNCEQVIWALKNYTSRGGEKAGCKDFADLLRYMALENLRYVRAEDVKVRGGGSY